MRKPGMVRARELLGQAVRQRRGSTAGSTASVPVEELLDTNITAHSETQIKVLWLAPIEKNTKRV